MKYFVDWDGTLMSTIQCICDLYNEDFRSYKNFKPIHWTDVETWDFQELNCAKPEYINYYFNQPRFFERIEYMPWAREALEEMRKDGEIIIVSSGFNPNLREKELWIEENLPFCKFVGVNLKEYSDKSHVDMSGESIFIDDSAKNLETSNAMLKICFGDVYDWNKDWKGLRCANWYDFKRDFCKGGTYR